MTKEEYERLLKSDYWKGYSYSLIKERNFTCHDCGRSFPGERNKLQVHHLHYRDSNPWSYDPDEIVVLCEECHKKRHGILPSNPPAPADTEYGKQVETSTDTRSINNSARATRDEVMARYSRYDDSVEDDRNWKVLLFLGLLLLALGVTGFYVKRHNSSESTVVPVASEAPVTNEMPVASDKANPSASKKAVANTVKREPAERLERLEDLVPAELQGLETKLQVAEPAAEEKKTEAVPVQTGEKTTIELLEKRNHANAVKRAEEVGVSTEGSTLDIMERINHANAVKRAEEVGVSSEGSTLDIMERINHANAVKRAEEVGVSTEGSTLDIMERITRKHLESVGQ